MQKYNKKQSISLYGQDGRRKYLTAQERYRFITAARTYPRSDIGTLCLTLAYCGCRISEALALTLHSVNAEDHAIAIRSLKKRGDVVIREVPIPDWLAERLAEVSNKQPETLWPLSRSRAWQLVKEVMALAQIEPGPHASPKGLRHGFGVHAIRSGVPLTLVQRWLGHASLSTTAIYLQVLGEEEREIARRMWP